MCDRLRLQVPWMGLRYYYFKNNANFYFSSYYTWAYLIRKGRTKYSDFQHLISVFNKTLVKTRTAAHNICLFTKYTTRWRMWKLAVYVCVFFSLKIYFLFVLNLFASPLTNTYIHTTNQYPALMRVGHWQGEKSESFSGWVGNKRNIEIHKASSLGKKLSETADCIHYAQHSTKHDKLAQTLTKRSADEGSEHPLI